MEDKLTFDNLRKLLDKFSSMDDVSMQYASALSDRINYGLY